MHKPWVIIPKFCKYTPPEFVTPDTEICIESIGDLKHFMEYMFVNETDIIDGWKKELNALSDDISADHGHDAKAKFDAEKSKLLEGALDDCIKSKKEDTLLDSVNSFCFNGALAKLEHIEGKPKFFENKVNIMKFVEWELLLDKKTIDEMQDKKVKGDFTTFAECVDIDIFTKESKCWQP